MTTSFQEAAVKGLDAAMGRKYVSDEVPRLYKPPVGYEYAYWQVETLLNQASEILDRLLRERSQYDDLRARELGLWLELAESANELELYKLKIGASGHLAERDNAQSELSSLDKSRTQVSSISGAIPLDSATHNEDARVWYFNHQNYDTSTGGMHYHLRPTAISVAASLRQQIRDDGAREVLARRVTNGQADADRLEIASKRLEEIHRVKDASTKGDGPMDFASRYLALERQIAVDYQAARERIAAVIRGLELYFGFDTARDGALEDNPSIFELSVWARKATNWLVKSSHKDQAITLTISLKEMLAGDWTKFASEMKSLGRAECAFKLDSLPNLPASCYLPRLAGISAYYVSATYEGPLAVAITVPKEAKTQRPSLGAMEIVELVQVATCYLGRVSNAKDMRPPEVAGVISLRNLSPLTRDSGTWKIRAECVSASGGGMGCEDLLVELGLNVRLS